MAEVYASASFTATGTVNSRARFEYEPEMQYTISPEGKFATGSLLRMNAVNGRAEYNGGGIPELNPTYNRLQPSRI